MVKIIKFILLTLISPLMIFGQTKTAVDISNDGLKFKTNDEIRYLNIPDRPANAVEGSEFAQQVTGLNLEDREKAVVREILLGNVPSFSRKLRPLTINKIINSTNYELTFYTVCDYMAIGSDQNYLYMPMTPAAAQYLADNLNCTLPTKKMVDIIYSKAEIKLHPQPIPPSDKMTTVPVFQQHTDSIKRQISQIGFDRSADNIIAGHKKDIIISNKIYSNDRNYDRVVIYGWHLSVNNPIQPVYNGHIAAYADYSHGVRLISNTALLNGDSIQVDDILTSAGLSPLLSDEGVINKPYYPGSDIFTSIGSLFENSPLFFKLNQNYPNPFNPSTTINYQLPEDGFVNIEVFNLLGEKIKTLVNEYRLPGIYSVNFTGDDSPSGVYIYRMQINNRTLAKKMTLLR
jgi:hypothetical protein